MPHEHHCRFVKSSSHKDNPPAQQEQSSSDIVADIHHVQRLCPQSISVGCFEVGPSTLSLRRCSQLRQTCPLWNFFGQLCRNLSKCHVLLTPLMCTYEHCLCDGAVDCLVSFAEDSSAVRQRASCCRRPLTWTWQA
jgi:hypothetical protein